MYERIVGICIAVGMLIFSFLMGCNDAGETSGQIRLWKALLLSFGDKVRIAGPEEYQKEPIDTAKNFCLITI